MTFHGALRPRGDTAWTAHAHAWNGAPSDALPVDREVGITQEYIGELAAGAYELVPCHHVALPPSPVD